MNQKIKFKLNRILSKLLFIIEFVISLILGILLYKTINEKVYNEILSIKYIIGIVICVIFIIFLIIKNYKKNKYKIEKIYISFMIPIGIMYLIFMIPTHVPDEQAHMWRSYEVSKGVVLTPIENEEEGKFYSKIPKFLIENVVSKNVNKYSDMNQALEQETDYEDIGEKRGSAESYNPVLYIFSSIGFFISRNIGLNGIIAEYLARTFNFIVFLVGTYYAIKIIPFGKLLFATIMFLPMIIHQAISMSADSLSNTICLFYIAYSLYLIFGEKKISKKEQWIFVILSILVGIAKIVYIPLVGISLLFIENKKLPKKDKIVIISATFIFTCLVSGGWYMLTAKYNAFSSYLQENNINATAQLQNIINYPIHLLSVIIRTTMQNGESYLYMLMGSNLGWLNINVPMITLIQFIILIVISILSEKNKYSLSRFQKIWFIAMTVVTVILIYMALYLSWTPVGNSTVLGIQGRYFIPILILPLLCFSMKDNYVKIKNINLIIMIYTSILNVTVLTKIVQFFI